MTPRWADSWPATSRGTGYGESAHDSTLIAGTTTAWPSPPACEEPAWLQCAVPPEISGVARHCSHARPDLSHSARRTVATMAYLYGSETADPPVSESIEDGGYAPKAAPWESAPQSRPASPTGPTRH